VAPAKLHRNTRISGEHSHGTIDASPLDMALIRHVIHRHDLTGRHAEHDLSGPRVGLLKELVGTARLPRATRPRCTVRKSRTIGVTAGSIMAAIMTSHMPAKRVARVGATCPGMASIMDGERAQMSTPTQATADISNRTAADVIRSRANTVRALRA
jgi:hypothetical protein